MKRASGFTLVELLVVIAIISILASIAVPNITQFLDRARMAKAEAEINSIETSLTAMLADAGKRDFSGTAFFTSFPAVANVEAAAEIYSRAFYLLLRVGNDAGGGEFPFADSGVVVNDQVRRSLGSSYMSDIGNDPWGNPYLIYPGPWRSQQGDIEFRMVSADESTPGLRRDSSEILYEDPDTAEQNIRTGYAAPSTKPFYIWSRGGNLASNQLSSFEYQSALASPNSITEPDLVGGGDDISNLDNTQSYATFYR